MKFDPFSFQSNRCFNSPEAVVYEYGANISDFWQARKPTIGSCWIPETFRLGKVSGERLFEKRCGNVNVDSLIIFLRFFTQ